jgi:hypothetical protein
VQARINITQIEMVALEEVGFLLLKKPIYPFVNYVGDKKFAPLNYPSACAPQNMFGNATYAHVYKPLNLHDWPLKQGMGRKSIVPTLSNYMLSKKTSGRWDELLKPHY